jgi:hypothetical protein
LKIWEIRIRDDRGKNSQALFSLEISPGERIRVIEGLVNTDYAEGPKADNLNAGSPLWVFGKMVKGRMIYIKISVGQINKPVLCISFHEAEHEMNFPLKNNRL